MKRNTIIIALLITIALIAAVPAYAGTWDNVKGWVTGQAIALILSGVLAVGVIGESLVLAKVIKTLKEGGQFMTVVADALEDKKISKSELDAIKAEGVDVFNVWAKTPDKYTVG